MFPFKARIEFDRDASQALYLQLSNQIIELIKNQTLAPKTKLPSSRILAEQLGVHRKTVVACYEELILQGWIESVPKKGTYVLGTMPILLQRKLENSTSVGLKPKPGFSYTLQTDLVERKDQSWEKGVIPLHDGIPDVRLAPLDEIARTYRRICSKKSTIDQISYGTSYGNTKLREVLVNYLNATRGLHLKVENVLITRGSQMGIWLASKLLIEKDDLVLVSKTNYSTADATFLNLQAQLIKVGVDEDGIITDEIESLCQQQQIKAVYVTSHHHHPTTVVLSAQRRIHLLNLARQYSFAILEDDYDYDFNYNRAPILPLASHDTNGNVIYIGSFCKTVAPVFRVGYLIAPKEFVDEAAKLRGIIDRQGDALLELTFADFLKSGDLDRHIRKVVKIYKQRRDLLCQLLHEELREHVEFEVPIGGMAIWLKLKSKYPWSRLSEIGKKYKLGIGAPLYYTNVDKDHGYLRLGFAEHNEAEIREVMKRFKKVIVELGGG